MPVNVAHTFCAVAKVVWCNRLTLQFSSVEYSAGPLSGAIKGPYIGISIVSIRWRKRRKLPVPMVAAEAHNGVWLMTVEGPFLMVIITVTIIPTVKIRMTD